jgi:Tol biopolymer transport system component
MAPEMARRPVRPGAPSPFVALVVIATLSACTRGEVPPARPTPGAHVVATPAPGTRSGETPSAGAVRIAFHSDPGGRDDLYAMNDDGSGLVQLTTGLEASVPPVWSPDGTRIAFVCCLPSRDAIYVVDADGTDLRRIADAPGEAGHPAWSPDGRRIAFSSFLDGRTYVVGVAGGPRPRILLREGTDASWSPDGSRLVFLSDRDGDLEIFTARADGSDQTQLTDNRAPDYEPAWSPDGRRILFVSERDGNSEVYAMSADGSRQVNLSRSPAPDDFPAWSPDGRSVAYVSYLGGADPNTVGAGNAEIFVAASDGSGRRDLTRDRRWDGDPAWSPDGSRLVFTRRAGHGELFTIGVDGTGLRELSGVPGEANDCCAAWRP